MLLAERYGWTPGQVDEIPLKTRKWILPIAHAIDEEREYRTRREQEKAQRKRG